MQTTLLAGLRFHTAVFQGINGWFRGMIAKLWQTVLTAAFQLMTFEYIRRAVITGLGAAA